MIIGGLFMKKALLVSTLFATLSSALVGCGDSNSYQVKTGTPIETLESFVSIYYFDKGTYANYKALYLEKKDIKKESEFTDYRKAYSADDVFEKGTTSSVDEVMSHMKVRKIDKKTVEIYWMKDPKKKGLEGATAYWILKKKGDQWLLDI
jgi:hypothetical protein